MATTDADEAARIAYNRTDWPGSESFHPEHLRSVHGATSGRFSSAQPNESNKPKGRIINPMEEAKAVEMVAGKKYIMVINVPRNLERARMDALQNSVPVYDEYFRARGIDLTLMVTDEPIQIYELEGACPTPKSSNV